MSAAGDVTCVHSAHERLDRVASKSGRFGACGDEDKLHLEHHRRQLARDSGRWRQLTGGAAPLTAPVQRGRRIWGAGGGTRRLQRWSLDLEQISRIWLGSTRGGTIGGGAGGQCRGASDARRARVRGCVV